MHRLQVLVRDELQRSAKRLVHGCEKFVPAPAYLFCLALPGSCLARFAYFIADLCIRSEYELREHYVLHLQAFRKSDNQLLLLHCPELWPRTGRWCNIRKTWTINPTNMFQGLCDIGDVKGRLRNPLLL